ncbi:hypothetical protein V6N12_065322 [Hibiscus sabdariffa]|uniref:DUF4283 domain-containing protein n=1 Tax=Hibiscus sabdariffa TaxID=183260 RepID=A0ABR2G8Q1_9ROSI
MVAKGRPMDGEKKVFKLVLSSARLWSWMKIALWMNQSRSISISEKHPSNLIVWVRLSGLLYRYYSKVLFMRIAHIVGKVIKVDYNTQAGKRVQEQKKGSRFGAFQVDDMMEGAHGEIFHQECNLSGFKPEHKAKKSGALKTDKDGMNVVPLVASEATKVVHHTVSRGNGNHGAISIVESGYEANVGASTRGGKGRRSISKAIGENTSEHLDVVMEQLYDDDGEFLDSSLDPLHRVVDRVLPDHELEQ